MTATHPIPDKFPLRHVSAVCGHPQIMRTVALAGVDCDKQPSYFFHLELSAPGVVALLIASWLDSWTSAAESWNRAAVMAVQQRVRPDIAILDSDAAVAPAVLSVADWRYVTWQPRSISEPPLLYDVLAGQTQPQLDYPATTIVTLNVRTMWLTFLENWYEFCNDRRAAVAATGAVKAASATLAESRDICDDIAGDTR